MRKSLGIESLSECGKYLESNRSQNAEITWGLLLMRLSSVGKGHRISQCLKRTRNEGVIVSFWQFSDYCQIRTHFALRQMCAAWYEIVMKTGVFRTSASKSRFTQVRKNDEMKLFSSQFRAKHCKNARRRHDFFEFRHFFVPCGIGLRPGTRKGS